MCCKRTFLLHVIIPLECCKTYVKILVKCFTCLLQVREEKVKLLTPKEAGYAIQLSGKTLLDVRPSTEHEKVNIFHLCSSLYQQTYTIGRLKYSGSTLLLFIEYNVYNVYKNVRPHIDLNGVDKFFILVLKAWVKGSTWIPIFDVDTQFDAGSLSRKVTSYMMGISTLYLLFDYMNRQSTPECIQLYHFCYCMYQVNKSSRFNKYNRTFFSSIYTIAKIVKLDALWCNLPLLNQIIPQPPLNFNKTYIMLLASISKESYPLYYPPTSNKNCPFCLL